MDNKTAAPAGEREEVEVVARLMHWKGRHPNPWKVVARMYSECTAGAYPNAWEEGEPLMTVAQHERILAAQQRTQSAGVPNEKPLPDLMLSSYHEAIGWNACRKAMLAAAPAQPEKVAHSAQWPTTPGLSAAPAQPPARDRVRASLSPENQRIVPVEPLLADPHPLATAQGEIQRLRAERDGFRESLNNLIEAVSIYLTEIADLREALTMFVHLAESRLRELGSLSPEMDKCLSKGRDALTASAGQTPAKCIGCDPADNNPECPACNGTGEGFNMGEVKP